MLDLCAEQLGVSPARGEEFVVAALLDDSALLEDDDLVGVADGAEAVGDDEAGSSAPQFGEGGLDEGFTFCVEVAGGFVEDEDPGIGEESTSDGEPLALSAAEPDASFSDDGVVALFECGDEGIGVGGACGGEDLGAGGVSSRVGDVVGDGAVEQEDVLLDDAEVCAVFGDGEIAEVDAVDEDATVGGVVEASDEVGEGCLAGAAGADESDGPSRGDVEADVLEDWRCWFAAGAWVGEGDVVEGDAALDGVHRAGRGVAFELAGFFEEIEDAIEGGEVGLDGGGGGSERFEGREQHEDVRGEHHDVTDGEVAAHDAGAAVKEDARGGGWDEESPDDFEESGAPPDEHFLTCEEVVGAHEAGALGGAAGESADDADAGKGLGALAVGAGAGDFEIAVDGSDAVDPLSVGDPDGGDEEDAADDESPIDGGENEEGSDELDDGAPGVVEEREEEITCGACVFAEEPGDAAALEGLDADEGEVHGAGEGAAAHAGLEEFGEPGGVISAPHADGGGE